MYYCYILQMAVVANFATVADCANSPSSNMFFICLEIVDLSRWNSFVNYFCIDCVVERKCKGF